MIFLFLGLELSDAHFLRLTESLAAYEQKAFDTAEAFKQLAIAFEEAKEAITWECKEYISLEREQERFQENGACQGPYQLTLPYSPRIRRFLFYG
jgi:hypothetical protein